ncbi:MAG: regulatory protein GemA [Ruthenibacterium sp.]
MAAINPYQIKSIYALGGSLGIKGGGHDDELHVLIQGIAGKTSIKELSYGEAEAILKELRERMKLSNITIKRPPVKKKNSYNPTPAGPSAAQIKMIWALMGELERWDTQTANVSIFERLCGIIQKELGVTAFERQPFQFVKADDITRLKKAIEGYTMSAYKKYMVSGKGAQHR